MAASDHDPFQSVHPSTAPSVSGASRVTPNQLGEYDLFDRIGAGGMGTVYRARHRRLQKIVAIKILPVSSQDRPASLARFEREMIAVGRLEHPNIIRAHDAGEENGVHYLVLEFADGYDLSKLSRRTGPMPIADSCELICQAALGLQYAHEHELVHRDIKPSNLLLTRRGIVKILDLGLALLSGESTPTGSEGLTTTGQIMGTLDFLSPEQADDTHSVDIRADIYSLGCTLYSLMIGHPPFVGESYSTPVRKIGAHMNRPLPDMRELRPEVPNGLVQILGKMTAKAARDRYDHPSEVVESLEPYTKDHNLIALLEEADKASDSNSLDWIETQLVGRSSLYETKNGNVFSVDSGLLVSEKATETQGAPKSRGKRFAWLIAIGLIAFVTLAAIVVTIRNKNGKIIAKIEVPEGGSYEASKSDDLMRKLPSKESTQEPVDNRGMSASENDDRKGWYGWPADAPAPAVATFNADQAKAHQEAWAKYLETPVEFENSIGMKFRLIPPCEFLMGSTPEEIEAASNIRGRNKTLRGNASREMPRHTAILTRPLYVGVTEVTQAQYQAVMGNNPAYFSVTGDGIDSVLDLDTANHPVEMVNWIDATTFCTKLSQETQLKSWNMNTESVEYRLPSTAEWEHACRAGTKTSFWTGAEQKGLLHAGWCSANAGGRTHAVGELQANPYGLFDTHGNVLEWTQDADRVEEDPPTDRMIDPVRPILKGDKIEMRGGSWINHPSFCRSSAHHPTFRSSRNRSIGFRVVVPVNEIER